MTTLDDLVVHPITKTTLLKLRANLPQSLLITGPSGIGLMTITRTIGGSTIVAELQPQNTKGEPDESGTISVEAVRRLYEQTRAKKRTHQVVVIDDADRMSHGAQSAFLKLLEEPAPHTSFVLTSHTPDKLLPTIRSRVQCIELRPPTAKQTQELIRLLGITDPTKTTQLLYLATGLPAEITRLIRDESVFSSRASTIGDARVFLQGTSYQKSLIAQKYRSDRTAALHLVDSAIAIVRRTLSTAPQQTLIDKLEHLLEIRENIANNYSIALQLMRFVL